MGSPSQPCRDCRHYSSEHTKGPKGYGTCLWEDTCVHANQQGCLHHSTRSAHVHAHLGKVVEMMQAIETLQSTITRLCPAGSSTDSALLRLREVMFWARDALEFGEEDKP